MLVKKVNILLLTLLTLLSTTVSAAVNTQYNATVCGSGTYLFGCEALTSSGPAQNVLGDSTVHLNLLFAAPKATKYTATIEPGQIYLFGCDQVSVDGSTASQTLQQAGCECDSTVTLTLRVQAPASKPVHVEYSASIKDGETYLFGCQQLTSTGDYTEVYGDSTVTVHLSVVPAGSVHVEYSASIKDGETYLFGCQQLTSTGAYTEVYGDSTVTVHLSVVPAAEPVHVEYSASIKDGETYLFGCQQLTSTGAYTEVYGDSTVTVHLSVVPAGSVHVEYSASIKDGETYLFGCQQLTSTGNYTEVYGDSTVTVHLSVVPATQPVHVEYSASIKDGETYLFGCQQLTSTGDYTEVYGDSTVTVHLSVVPAGSVHVEYSTSIKDGETYLFGCQQLTSTGAYTEVYGDSTVTVHLTVNAAEPISVEYTATIKQGEKYLFGCTPYDVAGTYTNTVPRIGVLGDSIIHLTLNVLNETYYDTTIVECDSLEWLGKKYYTGGEYIDTLVNVAGGDSIVTLHLTINHATVATTPETYTDCDMINLYGKDYTTSGIYTDTIANSVGCDSIITLDITIHETAYTEDYMSVCPSDLPYDWNGVIFTEAKDSVITLTNALGCDSIVTLHLTLKDVSTGDDYMSVCPSELPYTWQGVVFTEAKDSVITLTNALGCDSVVTLHLSVLATSTGDDYMSVCPSELPYTWQGVTFIGAADSVITLTNALGCDSVVTLHLSVLAASATEETAVDCDSYDWNGQTYTASGDYTFTTTNALGCDSVVTLHLTINKSVAVTETPDPVCNSYYWSEVDTTIVNTGSYTHVFQTIHGCDSTVTLNVTINSPYVDTLEVRSYYGDRIIMINRHQINSIPGWTAALDSIDTGAGYVKWYKISGATPDPETDEQVATGYYYTLPTGDPLPAGRYYATVEIPASDAAMCGAVGITEIHTVAGAVPAPALIPTLARPGEDIRVINLDPETETEIRIYSAEGMLIEKTAVSGEPYYIIHAAAETGFYLVEVVSDSMKSTLRYIVK